MIWNLKDLVCHCSSVQTEINGKWVPARPLPGPSIWRWSAAWEVFRGRADAFIWPEIDEDGPPTRLQVFWHRVMRRVSPPDTRKLKTPNAGGNGLGPACRDKSR